MKVVFAGPSLYGSRLALPHDLLLRGPARQGDLRAAVLEGANIIGLVDGRFENTPAVWHKEILYALSEGVSVFGAASMGALRAAECETFGMIGIGQVFQGFRDGIYFDDADVALDYGPPELGYLPLSIPYVDIQATVAGMRVQGLVSEDEGHALLSSAKQIFFKDRSWRSIVSGSRIEAARATELRAILAKRTVNLKRVDAEELLRIVAFTNDQRASSPTNWAMSHTTYFEQLAETLR